MVSRWVHARRVPLVVQFQSLAPREVRRMNARMGEFIEKGWTGGTPGGIMRPTIITLSLVSLLFAGSLAQSAQTVPAQPVPWHPCAKIAAACTPGFSLNGAKTGVGIGVDCIRPIMAGTPQRAQATKPLPSLDPQVIEACKERNPNFGMDGGPIVAFSMRIQ